MNKEALGRLILEASTGMHGEVAKQLSDAWAAMAEEVQQLGERNEDLRNDLGEAASTLRRYEALHRAKGTPESLEKAEVNAALAARFEGTLTQQPSKS